MMEVGAVVVSSADQMPPTRARGASPASRPAAGRSRRASPFEWFAVVVSLVVQQDGAFTSVPYLLSGDSLRVAVNPFNTMAVAISAAMIGLLVVRHAGRIAALASRNAMAVSFLLLVLLSATWSLHADLTLRRGAGYLLTIALAGVLVARFEGVDRMRALSASFAVSALGSLLFIVLVPHAGIMQTGTLTGAWRGVFPHKNVFGPVMALAVFVELYIIVTEPNHSRWRFALLGLFASLVVLSQSATAVMLTSFYGLGAGLYILWRRHRLIGAVALIDALLILLAAAIVVGSDPGAALGAIGKDATLTGRVAVWDVVLAFIREKPFLGWGYHAMWVVGDPTTTFADRVAGRWGITSAHNAFLEIALQLGLTGLLVMLMMVGVALWRAIRCCRAGIPALGWFSLVYVSGAVLAAQTIETLGRSQAIDWAVFNVLLFACGAALARLAPSRAAARLTMATKPPNERSLAASRPGDATAWTPTTAEVRS